MHSKSLYKTGSITGTEIFYFIGHSSSILNLYQLVAQHSKGKKNPTPLYVCLPGTCINR